MEGLSGHWVDLGVAALAAVTAVVVWGLRRRHARATASAQQRLAAHAGLDRALAPPQLAWLTPPQQARWQQQVRRFLRQKRFIGCAGLAISERHRQTIAGIACLLRVQEGAEHDALFPAVHEVLLYPDAFLVPPQREVSEDGMELVADAPDERIGEHGPGQVVLSWADVLAALEGDTVNVVIHEFAHALDSENPATEGAPPMADYREWSAAMAREFARLKRHRRPPVLDPYGAESPAEFWCVVAEAFFQQPEALARHHADLYGLLSSYLQIAPASGAAFSAPAGAPPLPADSPLAAAERGG